MIDDKTGEKGKVAFILLIAVGVIVVSYFVFVFLFPMG